MDPRDDLDSLGGGVDCAACGVAVPTERIRVLARRDDIAFVEIHCPTCRSESLGIVIASDEADDAEDGLAVGPGLAWGEFGPGDEERFRDASPIGSADIEHVRDLLARGGLAALVDRREPPAAGSGR
jgi:phage FluMu protein Com